MTEERFKIRSASYIIVMKDNRILLQKRAGTNFMCGWYCVPCGHLENREGAKGCAIRELKEETSLESTKDDLEFKFVLSRVSDDGNEYIDLFFLAKHYKGTPKIMEPEKCSELDFFDLDNLPKNTVPYVRDVLKKMKCDNFGEIGY